MARIAFIGGSGFAFSREPTLTLGMVATPFGAAAIASGEVAGHTVSFLSRHGPDHERLSHQVQHRANIWALRELGTEAIVASTAVGVLEPSLPLGVPILFDDLFFPSNRLPDGSLATFFVGTGDPRRGHWIPREPFSPALRRLLAESASRVPCSVFDAGCYAHADGPRFNTGAEHAAMRAAGAVAVSQTCGPEAVLAGEAGIPYALVGFGVNYAGEASSPTGSSIGLEALLARHAEVVGALERAFLEVVPAAFAFPLDTGSVFRMAPGDPPS